MDRCFEVWLRASILIYTNAGMNPAPTNQRVPELDLIRLVACLLVILVHIDGVNLVNLNSSGWAASNYFESFGRVCVPLFFMISGATLVRRIDPIGEFLRKRFIRIIPPLVFWTVVYLLYRSYRDGHVWPDTYWFLLYSPSQVHLWYLYALVGLYPFLPIVARMYKACSPNETSYLLLLWFISATAVPAIKYWFPGSPNLDIYSLTTFTGYMGFFVAGALLADVAPKMTRFQGVIGLFVYIAASVAIAELTAWRSSAQQTWVGVFLIYLTPFVALASLGLFAFLVKDGRALVGDRALRMLSAFAPYALGVYCIHVIVRNEIANFGLTVAIKPTILSTPLVTFSIFLVSLAAIWLLRLIPGAKWIM